MNKIRNKSIIKKICAISTHNTENATELAFLSKVLQLPESVLRHQIDCKKLFSLSLQCNYPSSWKAGDVGHRTGTDGATLHHTIAKSRLRATADFLPIEDVKEVLKKVCKENQLHLDIDSKSSLHLREFLKRALVNCTVILKPGPSPEDRTDDNGAATTDASFDRETGRETPISHLCNSFYKEMFPLYTEKGLDIFELGAWRKRVINFFTHIITSSMESKVKDQEWALQKHKDGHVEVCKANAQDPNMFGFHFTMSSAYQGFSKTIFSDWFNIDYKETGEKVTLTYAINPSIVTKVSPEQFGVFQDCIEAFMLFGSRTNLMDVKENKVSLDDILSYCYVENELETPRISFGREMEFFNLLTRITDRNLLKESHGIDFETPEYYEIAVFIKEFLVDYDKLVEEIKILNNDIGDAYRVLEIKRKNILSLEEKLEDPETRLDPKLQLELIRQLEILDAQFPEYEYRKQILLQEGQERRLELNQLTRSLYPSFLASLDHKNKLDTTKIHESDQKKRFLLNEIKQIQLDTKVTLVDIEHYQEETRLLKETLQAITRLSTPDELLIADYERKINENDALLARLKDKQTTLQEYTDRVEKELDECIKSIDSAKEEIDEEEWALYERFCQFMACDIHGRLKEIVGELHDTVKIIKGNLTELKYSNYIQAAKDMRLEHQLPIRSTASLEKQLEERSIVSGNSINSVRNALSVNPRPQKPRKSRMSGQLSIENPSFHNMIWKDGELYMVIGFDESADPPAIEFRKEWRFEVAPKSSKLLVKVSEIQDLPSYVQDYKESYRKGEGDPSKTAILAKHKRRILQKLNGQFNLENFHIQIQNDLTNKNVSANNQSKIKQHINEHISRSLFLSKDMAASYKRLQRENHDALEIRKNTQNLFKKPLDVQLRLLIQEKTLDKFGLEIDDEEREAFISYLKSAKSPDLLKSGCLCADYELQLKHFRVNGLDEKVLLREALLSFTDQSYPDQITEKMLIEKAEAIYVEREEISRSMPFFTLGPIKAPDLLQASNLFIEELLQAEVFENNRELCPDYQEKLDVINIFEPELTRFFKETFTEFIQTEITSDQLFDEDRFAEFVNTRYNRLRKAQSLYLPTKKPNFRHLASPFIAEAKAKNSLDPYGLIIASSTQVMNQLKDPTERFHHLHSQAIQALSKIHFADMTRYILNQLDKVGRAKPQQLNWSHIVELQVSHRREDITLPSGNIEKGVREVVTMALDAQKFDDPVKMAKIREQEEDHAEIEEFIKEFNFGITVASEPFNTAAQSLTTAIKSTMGERAALLPVGKGDKQQYQVAVPLPRANVHESLIEKVLTLTPPDEESEDPESPETPLVEFRAILENNDDNDNSDTLKPIPSLDRRLLS